MRELWRLLLGGVQTSHWDQNAPHDFLYTPQLKEICTQIVEGIAELESCI